MMKEYVSKNSKLILDAFDYIWQNAETGYREWKTHNYLKEKFLSLGYKIVEAQNIPGFYAEIDTKKEGPTIAVFAEMDAIIVPTHPDADKETGAVHACGHATQTASILGLAAALKEPDALKDLSGKIRLVVVPAEEGIEYDFRQDLINKGIIKYTSGKVEFLYRGLLDGVDLSFMIHADVDGKHCGSMNGGSNGAISKQARFEGVAAHAGGLPHKGINALYAANMALSAINSLRETFEDHQHIRVHPIISKGGSSVNAIPDEVVLETFVRGATMDATVLSNDKINRAIAAAAASMGAKVKITDRVGSFPRYNDRTMMKTFKNAMDDVLTYVDCGPERWNAGCSDMGDMASLMPTIQAYVGGAVGTEHGADYFIEDKETACVDAAKIYAVVVRMLLENGAEKAKEVISNYKPFFKTNDEYFEYKDKINRDFDAVSYDEKGNVTLNLAK